MISFLEVIPDETAYLIPLGDLHLGDKLFTKNSEKKLRGYIDWILEHPNARVILNGDIFNTSTRISKTSPFEQNVRIQQRAEDDVSFDEMEFAIELLSPIKNQIIGATDGNHENRLIDMANFSLTNALCHRLSTFQRKVYYFGSSVLLFLKVGKSKEKRRFKYGSAQTYSGYIHHTTGGGRTVGSKLNRAGMLREIVAGCDFYIGNHNHQEAVAKTKIFIPDIQNHAIKEVRQQIINGGGFLDYGGYVEKGQLSPVDIGAPRIRFDSHKHDIHVSL